MKLRKYRSEDHPALCAWWRGHGWGETALPASCIPLGTTLMVETEDAEPVACVVVYKFEGVPLARVGFVVSNPNLSPRVRVAALKELGSGVIDLFQELGVLTAWALYDNRTLLRVFEDAGFVQTRENVTELTWSPNICQRRVSAGEGL